MQSKPVCQTKKKKKTPTISFYVRLRANEKLASSEMPNKYASKFQWKLLLAVSSFILYTPICMLRALCNNQPSSLLRTIFSRMAAFKFLQRQTTK